MPSLNLDLDYFDHPKTRRLIGLVGRGSEVLPIRLWCYCGKYHSGDGSLAGYSAQEIESIVGWWGKPGELVQALVALVFLEERPGGYVVHDWLEHAGHLEAYRKKAKNAARARWGLGAEAAETGDGAGGMPGSIPGVSTGDAPSIAPARQGSTREPPLTPPRGGGSRRTPLRVARALVGAHPPPARPVRQVTAESPTWVIGIATALSHPARPDVPEELAARFAAWTRGEVGDDQEPPGWRVALKAAVAEAVQAEACAAAGGRR